MLCKEKIPTLADTIVSNKGRYYGAGDGLVCIFAVGENRGSHQCLHCYGFESAHKRNNKSHSECIIHYGIYWHILHFFVQCNAVWRCVAFVKLQNFLRGNMDTQNPHVLKNIKSKA